ncbi:nitroreductase [Lactobacillus sp. PV037]|uniref:nitroreductase n=1 Tax=unclassified Lactobacillus TaxID=2620435 RepID=UPI00223FBFD7|nr:MULTISPECIES: nitroreductase [unclassified Lactobacillus]QNQ81665.1 nitroreductase [Lactobacillus sp. PV012]QNQ84288.1 nitroreductase [Lactobacillus sp. PV037]
MSFKELMEKRHAVREFSDKKVRKEDIEDILTEASFAPSWENAQPWHVHVAIGEALEAIKKEHLELADKGTISWTDIKPITPDDMDRYSSDNVGKFTEELSDFTKADYSFFEDRQRHLYNAQALIYITVDEKAVPYMFYDLGAFGQSILLAAAEKGIDSIPAYEIVRFPDSIRKHIDIPEHEKIFMGIALGYADDERINEFKPSRRKLEDFAKFSE